MEYCTPAASLARPTSMRSFINNGTPWERQSARQALSVSKNSCVLEAVKENLRD